MFASKGKTTVIAEGLRIIGSVSADGAVQVNGQIDGDLNCTSITVSPKALITGAIKARRVVINGKVEGPISGEDVVLKPHAFVTGDIQAQSLSSTQGRDHGTPRSIRPKSFACASGRADTCGLPDQDRSPDGLCSRLHPL
jgi:cytoskeletal protein CcmA (bactofilin family)